MKRKADASWKGNLKEGTGKLSTQSGALKDTSYSFKSRFEDEEGKAGTNPEELIGAAHAGCFSMALSNMIADAGYTPDEVSTTATVSIDKVEGGFAIGSIKLDLKGKVSGMDETKFKELANNAKEGCPVSKALSAVPIELVIAFEA